MKIYYYKFVLDFNNFPSLFTGIIELFFLKLYLSCKFLRNSTLKSLLETQMT